jgi:SET domain-containing protein
MSDKPKYDETSPNCCACEQWRCDETCLCYHAKTTCKHACPCRWKLPRNLQDVSLEVIDQGPLGKGVKTLEFIKKGVYILEYCGMMVRSENDVLKILKKGPPLYVMDVGSHWINAVGKSANISRYINHGCSPNLAVDVWDVDGNNKAFIRTAQDIEPDSCLSFDYNSQYHTERLDIPRIQCRCIPDCPNFI